LLLFIPHPFFRSHIHTLYLAFLIAIISPCLRTVLVVAAEAVEVEVAFGAAKAGHPSVAVTEVGKVVITNVVVAVVAGADIAVVEETVAAVVATPALMFSGKQAHHTKSSVHDANSSVYSGVDQRPPKPDAQITELEDRWIQQHGILDPKASISQVASKMADLSTKDAALPVRPRFGQGGTPVTLWANYFRMRPTVKSLYKYDLHIATKRVTKKQAEAAKREASASGKANQPQSGGGQAGDNKGPRGKKLEKIIQRALAQLGNAVVATEYKQQLISLEKLRLPEDNIMQIDLVEPPRRPETWFVRFDGPVSLDIDGLMTYLRTLEDPGKEAVFPKFPDEIDALGIVLGHTARASRDTAAVGRSRFFAVDNARKEAAPQMSRGSLLEILRGYVQSVRPATGRLLLNTNVTHGVFRTEGLLSKLFEDLGLVNVHRPDELSPAERRTLEARLESAHKILGKARIRCKVPGEKIEIERTMAGLATTRDGKDDDPRPMFQYRSFGFASPATVKFHLRPPSQAGAAPPPGLNYGDMVIVADYYKARESPVFLPSCLVARSNPTRISPESRRPFSLDQRRDQRQADLSLGRALHAGPGAAVESQTVGGPGHHDQVCLPLASRERRVHHEVGQTGACAG
jgi:hypothetical protein